MPVAGLAAANDPLVSAAGDPKSTNKPSKAPLVLLAAGLAITAVLLAQRNIPVTLDQAVYAVVGNELLHGKHLYSEIWDHKPPLIHILYAGSVWLFGLSSLSILVPAIVCSLLTLLGVYKAAQLGGFGSRSGCWAAIYWTVVSLFPALQQPSNTEAMINACLIWVLFLFLRFAQDRMPWRYALLAGALLAAASLFKQIAIFPFLCAVPVYLLAGPRTWASLCSRLSRVFLILLCVAAAWLCTTAAFWLQGHFTDFWDAVIVYNRGYSGSLWTNLLSTRYQAWAMLLPALVMVPPLLVILMERTAVWHVCTAPFYIMLAFAAGTVVAVAAPGRWYPHYFQLWSPLLAVAAGWAGGLLARLPGTRRRYLAGAFMTLPLLPLLLIGAETHLWAMRHPPRWSSLREAYRLAPRIPQILEPGQTFFAYEGGAWFYLLTGQRSPTCVFYNWPMLGGPLAQKLSRRTVSDLERTQPALVILERKTLLRIMATAAHQRPLVERYIAEHYAAAPGDKPREHYAVLTRLPGGTRAPASNASPG